MLEMEGVIQLIGNFGFPIVITMYLLHRIENKIDSLGNAIHTLSKVLVKDK